MSPFFSITPYWSVVWKRGCQFDTHILALGEEFCMKELLPLLPRPTHYLGTEVNAVHKPREQVRLRWGLAFPDLYEIGMSHLGLKILYHGLNAVDQIQAERVFAPHPDVARELRARHLPLCTLESDTPLGELDVLGFSLTHELCYTTVLYILDLAGIPFRSSRRGDALPLILAGGGAACNPEPVAAFFDAFVIGDGEEAVLDISACVETAKEQGRSKQELLRALAAIPGLYVPARMNPSQAQSVQRRVLMDLNAAEYPTRPVIPFGKAVHDRFTLEIARGCSRGCRFCQAGMISRPVRERSLGSLERITTQGLDRTGFEELSFLALSVGDFSQLEQLFAQSFLRCSQEQVTVSLPSLRVGSLSPHLMGLISRLRRTGVTLAPEAGTQRLRDVINKGISDDDLFLHAQKVFELGWNRIKLYFMIGLPTETREDVQAILDLCLQVRALARRSGTKRLKITASLAPFVPKPHTPFQWEGQEQLCVLREKIAWLRDAFSKQAALELQWHSPEMSLVEGLLSRGGRDLDTLLESAYARGDILTSWKDYFHFEIWLQAVNAAGLDMKALTGPRDPEARLPWAHIHCGPSRTFLLQERSKALQGRITPDCRYHACEGCGVCDSPRTSLRAGDVPDAGIGPRINQDRRDQDGGAVHERPAPGPAPRSELGHKQAHLRFWFEKTGPARYLSQLELQTILERTFRRAALPLSFSRGFHPLPLLSFGQALPVGVASLCEWCNVFLRTPMQPEDIDLQALNRFVPRGIRFTAIEALSLQKKQARPLMETFDLTLYTPEDRARQIQSVWNAVLLRESYPVTQKTRKGPRQVDIRKHVQSVRPLARDTFRLLLDWQQGYCSPLAIVKGVIPDLAMQDFDLLKVGLHLDSGEKTETPGLA